MHMERLTPETLDNIRSQRRQHDCLSTGRTRVRVTVHMGTCGIASGARDVYEALEQELQKAGAHDVAVAASGCMGICSREPLMTVCEAGTDPVVYQLLTPEAARTIVREHICSGKVPTGYVMARGTEHDQRREPLSRADLPHIKESPFFSPQYTIALRNRGALDAGDLYAYIARDGYSALAQALSTMTPEDVVQRVADSGLRGRGGGGFPTGMKWKFAARETAEIKYILCNADEGDPGAFMDRSILESDPHSVVEGMIIAGYAIGARFGYIYCRAEYPLAVSTLTDALDKARECGLLGENILGTGYSLDIELYQGAGAFVCGEETALMASIEGKRGMPRPRPPFPAQKGLWARPSVLNNVETFACVPPIIIRGSDWFSSIGTERSKGTKVFALTGAVNNVGLVEVPMGTPIGDIIFDIGGGIAGGKQFKAAQLGGPSGGCIPASALNTPTDYDEIANIGAIMGSGGLIVMDEDTCMVDTARFFMEFCQDESCGKCTPCREGTKRMLAILERICSGQGRTGDIELLEELAGFIKDSALCGLGQTAPNPVLSTLRYFRHEYEAHIEQKRCPAGVCAALFTSPCQNACPIGMDVPGYIALVRAGRLDDAYRVMKRTNPFPGICGRVCPQFCAHKCRRGQLDQPLAIAWLKRFIADNAAVPATGPLPVTRSEKIAIVGSGPAGLTAAQDLALRGYMAVVFEQHPEPGGMMRYGIPAYRLPRDVIDTETGYIQALGVEIRTGIRVGRDISVARLREEFACVLLSPGAPVSGRLGISGDDLKGVVGATEFLRDVHLGREVSVGRSAVVIGGGNTAIDAARTVRRLGARQVTILYRREKKDMPAWEHEIDAALSEGIQLEVMTAPVSVDGRGGRVSGLCCQRMKAGTFDPSGRRRPVPADETPFTLDADMIIPAISQLPDTEFAAEKENIPLSRNGLIKTIGSCAAATGAPGVFAAGDAVSGPATVVEAIAMGHRAASDIDSYIRDKNSEPPYAEPEQERIDIPVEIDDEAKEHNREIMPELTPGKRIDNFSEVELGYTPDAARREACRCLRCDVQED